jgi:N utilization substance protein B
MGKRRKARESTLQILFQLEFDNSQPDVALGRFWEAKKASKEVQEYCSWLVNGILSHREQIDSIIQSVSENWRISRMAAVDLNILRMAVFELFYEENVAAAVVINEAIEIAKKYSSDKAGTFINGVLDAIIKKKNKITASLKEEENG